MSSRILPLSALLLLATACGPDGTNQLGAKNINPGDYQVDWEAFNQAFPDQYHPAQDLTDLGSVYVHYHPDAPPVKAQTHIFGNEEDITVIPYSDEAGADEAVARAFGPGDVGYAIKHHRPGHRTLNLANLADPEAAKEDLKFRTTHIGNIVGIDSDEYKVVTLNNPQTYQDGRWGSPDYPMIMARPVFPSYAADAGVDDAFKDQVRTMLAAFNAVSEFPGDYNGGDPLATFTVENIGNAMTHMLMAFNETDPTRAEAGIGFFREPANLVYCAELAHLATSAAIHFPLNEGLLDPNAPHYLAGIVEGDLQGFFNQAEQHNNELGSGEANTVFTQYNDNEFAGYVEVTRAEKDLAPLWTYLPEEQQQNNKGRLAFNAMTAGDMIAQFLAAHIPRDTMREQMFAAYEAQNGAVDREDSEAMRQALEAADGVGASLQGTMLEAMLPGLMDAIGIGPADLNLAKGLRTDPYTGETTPIEDFEADTSMVAKIEGAQHGVYCFFYRNTSNQEEVAGDEPCLTSAGEIDDRQSLLEVLETKYASREEMDDAMYELLAEAQGFTTPRSADGLGWFVPPSLLVNTLSGRINMTEGIGGMVGLEYVGHGVHWSQIQ